MTVQINQDNPLYGIAKYMEDQVTETNNAREIANTWYQRYLGESELVAKLTTPAWEAQANRILIAGQYAAQLRIPYVFGAEYENNKAFDCSSFVQSIFRMGMVNLPRTSVSQSTAGREVAYEELRKGDLIFFDTNADGKINHVGVMMDNERMLHTNNPAEGTHIEEVAVKYKKWFVTARRILE